VTLRVTPAEIVAKAEASGRPGVLALGPGWSRVRLGDVARVVNGAAFPSHHFNVTRDGLPLIRIRDVRTSVVSTWYDGPWEPVHLVEPGALLIGMDGDFNAGTWRGPTGVLNQRVCRIDVDTERYDRRFLELAIQGYLDAIGAATSSTTVKHLSSRSVADIPLPCPPLPEQRRIVEILEDHLSRLDAADRFVERTRSRLDTLAEAVLRSWLHSHYAPDVPLSRVLRQPLTNGRSVPTLADGFPVLRLTALKDDRVSLSERKAGAWTAEHAHDYLVEKDDIFVSRGNGSLKLVGRAARVTEDPDPVAFPDTMIRIRPSTDQVFPAYLVAVWNSRIVRRQIERAARTTAGIYKVNQQDLASVVIPLPARADQQELMARVRDTRDRAAVAEREVVTASRQSRSLRHALLTAAFSGRLTGRSSDLEIAEELASV
jgi:type I restriction enzyme S subunit